MNENSVPTTSFQPFSKIPRLSREIVVTEKIDGTNAQILIVPCREVSYHDSKQAVVVGDGAVENAMTIFAGSRNRWIQPGNDNFGFAAWVKENAQGLLKLGPGRHFGEWWGLGIQRGYNQTKKRFSLFNVKRWEPIHDGDGNVWAIRNEEDRNLQLACCGVVPVLYRGPFDTDAIQHCLDLLGGNGSVAAPGFKDPEGIVIYHTASGHLFKKTIKGDEAPKTLPTLTNPAQLEAGVEAAQHAFIEKCPRN